MQRFQAKVLLDMPEQDERLKRARIRVSSGVDGHIYMNVKLICLAGSGLRVRDVGLVRWFSF